MSKSVSLPLCVLFICGRMGESLFPREEMRWYKQLSEWPIKNWMKEWCQEEVLGKAVWKTVFRNIGEQKMLKQIMKTHQGKSTKASSSMWFRLLKTLVLSLKDLCLLFFFCIKRFNVFYILLTQKCLLVSELLAVSYLD